MPTFRARVALAVRPLLAPLALLLTLAASSAAPFEFELRTTPDHILEYPPIVLPMAPAALSLPVATQDFLRVPFTVGGDHPRTIYVKLSVHLIDYGDRNTLPAPLGPTSLRTIEFLQAIRKYK